MPPPTSNKRKLPSAILQRRVRARKEEPEPELEEVFSDESAEEDDSAEEGSSDDGESDRASNADATDSESSSNDDDDDDEDDLDPALVPFSKLAKAQQDYLSEQRQKAQGHADSNGESAEDDEDGNNGKEGNKYWDPSKYEKSSSSKKQPKHQRSSKHAPVEVTSKRPVTRKREVVSSTKVLPRDPRFSAASGPVDEERARRAYSFLDEYRASEMAQVRDAIKKTKAPAAKEELKRALVSMQSRKQAQERKDAERAVVADHRKHEKELVAQGKQPFYLKRGELKKRVLVDRFAGMKKKQVDRTIERRRKKVTAKERKDMPFARRGAVEE
ncbi:Uu.00g092690.m01.CDS01 [Anthostomella pinea]|uniref:rRNA biogenesis protein RRP36 n=1 Tax=Anthostomella pinea TaxID=933095 RepID=A0AAI8VNE7_9PEZI|nr:Uu.00g092690.m01.CDS01 [Anthostomella pinea]